MRKAIPGLFALLAAMSLASGVGAESLTAGDQAQSFTLPNHDGVNHALHQYMDSTATVVMFIATQCPVSNAYNERMSALSGEYQPKGIQFVGINSNRQESVEEIAEHAGVNGFAFPVLKDNGNVIADRFGATRTPEIYVLSPTGEVLYHGRIDDSQNADRIEARDLAAALDAVLAGEDIPLTETRAFGCTIKRVP